MLNFFAGVFLLFIFALTFTSGEEELVVRSIRPSNLNNQPWNLRGRQALTVVFNRAVIAFGSDWGSGDLSPELTPFTLDGNKVPGSTRWVTTSIARFDPETDWLTDNQFTLSVSPGLASFDGLVVSAGDQEASLSRTYQTAPLQLSSMSVSSKKLSELTGRQWSSCTRSLNPGDLRENTDAQGRSMCEIPDDGVVRLQFSSLVDVDMLKSVLSLVPADSKSSLTFDLAACPGTTDRHNTRCVGVRTPPLQSHTRHSFIIPAGSTYHQFSGPLAKTIEKQVSGPFAFVFPFRPSSQLGRVQYQSYNLLLRHGLPSTRSDDEWLALFKSQIALKPAIPFTLSRPNLATLRLTADWAVGQLYNVSVASSDAVVDGLNLPLRASWTEVKPAPASVYQVDGSSAASRGTVSFEKSFAEPWAVIHQGQSCSTQYHGTQVSSANIQAALRSVFTQTQMSSRDVTLVVPSSKAADTVVLGAQDSSHQLFGNSGIFLRERIASQWNEWQNKCNEYQNYDAKLVQRSGVAAHFAVSQAGGIRVWVSRTDNGAARVANAMVSIFCGERNYRSGGDPLPNLLQSAFTDADGLAQFTGIDRSRCQYAPVVVNGFDGTSSMFYAGEVPYFYSTPDQGRLKATLITDRALYKGGDKLYVKGYVRLQKGSSTSLPLMVQMNQYQLSVKWSRADEQPTIHSVTFSDEFGSFEAILDIPANADYGSKVITLAQAASSSATTTSSSSSDPVDSPVIFPGKLGFVDGGVIYDSPDLPVYGHTIGSASIDIADPRIPTGVLEVALSEEGDVYKPHAPGIKLDISTSTYIGTGIPNATVTLRWRLRQRSAWDPARPMYGLIDAIRWFSSPAQPALPDIESENDDVPTTGELTLTTDSQGTLTSYLFLLPDNLEPEDGDTVELTVDWIGPTRELLSESLSVPVRPSKWQIGLRISTSDPLPGYEFGLATEVIDVAGAPVTAPDAPKVELKLIPIDVDEQLTLAVPDGAATGAPPRLAPLRQQATQTCTVDTSAVTSLQYGCKFLLPSVGKFIVLAQAVDQDNFIIETVLPVGKSLLEWQAQPLASWSGVTGLLDKPSYQFGDQATISFVNPFDSCRIMVVHGNKLTSSYKFVDCPPQNELASVSVDITKELCTGGCDIQLMIAAPRGQNLLPVNVPVSKLFDMSMPAYTEIRQSIDVVDTQFDLGSVTVAPAKEQAQPGEELTVSVNLKDDQGDPVDGEVYLVAVDQKILDLRPHALSAPSSTYQLRLRDSLSNRATEPELCLAAGYSASQAVWDRRVRMDRWITPEFQLKSNNNFCFYCRQSPISPVDQSDEQYFERFSSQITSFPSYIYYPTLGGGGGGGALCKKSSGCFPGGVGGGDVEYRSGDVADGDVAAFAPSAEGGAVADEGLTMMKAFNSPQDLSASASASDSDSSSAPFVRGDSVFTPFAGSLKTTNGKATFTVKLPDNVSTFKLRAYAVAGANRFGQDETEIVSARSVSIEPSGPRQVRVGDLFLAGASIVPKTTQFPLTLQVSATPDCRAIKLLETTSKTVTLVDSAPVRVEWVMRGASGTGSGSLRFKVQDTQGNEIDAVDFTIPVLGSQEPVDVATSFAIPATPTKQAWKEGLKPPAFESGSGSLQVEGGVGRLPSLVYLSQRIMDAAHERRPSGMDLVAGLLPSLTLGSPYKLSQDVSNRVTQTRLLAHGLLPSYTLNNVGLVYYPPTYTTSTLMQPAVDLNAFAVYINGKLPAEFQIAPSVQSTWERAIDTGIVRQALDARRFGHQFSNFNLLATVFLANGLDWVPRGANSQVLADLSLTTLLANESKLGSNGRATLAMALLEHGQGGKAVSAINFLQNQLRVQGRTAYLARSSGSSNADHLASGRALAAFVLNGDRSSDPVVEKLANFVAGADNSAPSGFYFSRSSQQLAFSSYALWSYDKMAGNQNPDLQFSVQTGNLRFLSGKFDSASDVPVSRVARYEQLPDSFASNGLTFYSWGRSGEVSVVAGLNFVPLTISTEPIYRGFHVEKIVRQFDPTTGRAIGEPITFAEPGSQVQITIQIRTPDDVRDVRVIDPLAGCIEAFDIEPRRFSPYDFGWWYYEAFPVQEIYKDRFQAFSNYLYAGSHQIQYTALVVTPGKFTFPPTKVFAVRQPELLGLSAGGEFLAHTSGGSSVQELAASSVGTNSDSDCFDAEPILKLTDFVEPEPTPLANNSLARNIEWFTLVATTFVALVLAC